MSNNLNEIFNENNTGGVDIEVILRKSTFPIFGIFRAKLRTCQI